jgi:putative ABC transport system permease protein
MKFLPLIWHNLMRRKIRTIFTLLSILVAFVLYGYLAALSAGFSAGVDVADADRLVLIHKVSLIQLLPISYGPRIAQTEGVVDVCHFTFFGGIYQKKQSNFFMQMPVVPECLFKLYPEFVLPDAQKKAWLADRTGAIVGRATANRFGWKVDDRVPLQATIWQQRDRQTTWTFTIDGIYDGAKKGVDTTQFFFHYDYFDEARWFGQGMVGWYVIRVDHPERAADVAKRLDAMFANSPEETKTTAEKAFAQAFLNQIGDIGLIIRSILAVVFFVLLFVAGNTMAQSVRERTNELAVLKTLGFTNPGVLALVLAESCCLAVVGGGLGLALVTLLTRAGDPTGGLIPGFILRARDVLVGVGLTLALGIVAGVFPALRATRLRIADALRRS